MSRIFGAIETLVRDADERVALFPVLRICGDAVVHGHADGKVEWTENLSERDTNAAAQCGSLRRVGLREEKREFVATDSKRGVGSTKGLS